MKTKSLLIILITSLSVATQCSSSKSKDYKVINLRSLENKKVNVKYTFDPHTDRLILELNKREKMCIQDARGLDTAAIILANKFIELPIVMRGGSGEAVRKCVLICISKGKMYKSLDVVSLIKNTITGISDIELNISGLIEKNNSFGLILGRTTIPFDPDKKIFFDGYYTLNGPYYVNSDKDYSSKKEIFQNETFPSLFNNYVFINNKWYGVGSFSLTERTSTCN